MTYFCEAAGLDARTVAGSGRVLEPARGLYWSRIWAV